MVLHVSVGWFVCFFACVQKEFSWTADLACSRFTEEDAELKNWSSEAEFRMPSEVSARLEGMVLLKIKTEVTHWNWKLCDMLLVKCGRKLEILVFQGRSTLYSHPLKYAQMQC